MKKITFFVGLIFCLLCSIYREAVAQYQPIYHYYSEKNSWYNDYQFAHTSLQPFYSIDTATPTKSNRKYWFGRKLYDEDLLNIYKENVSLKINFLPDIFIGNDEENFIWNNTRGFKFNGSVSSNFSFNLEIYETQSKFANYIDSINLTQKAVIGQGWFEPRNTKGLMYDYTYAIANIAYKTKYFRFNLANDKLFIGDGYRSLLLSDVSVPYPYLNITFESKKLQYSAIYMQHIDQMAPKLSPELGFQKKWAVMHYLNWNIGSKWSLGLFDAVVWQDADTTGKRGFEMSYANPIIFLRAAEYNTSSSDNALLGINLKYKLNNNNKIYSQLLIDELKISEYVANKGWWANKFGLQLGLRSRNIFRMEKLNGFTEFNLVKPYTYSHKNTLRSYTNYGEALAHPIGANFIENVTRLEYAFGRWTTLLQVNYAQYGLDSITGTNVGKNILASYYSRDRDYNNKLLQGIPGSLLFIDTRLGYVFNPKTNLKLELGYIYRNDNIDGKSNASNIITFGLRSSFRNLYFDR